MKSTTPKTVNNDVIKLRTKIGLTSDPVFVPVRDTMGHKMDDCFHNVERKIQQDGGNIQYGWTIWEVPGRFIEAEFHAVWISQTGDFIDITPHADGESWILFTPDNDREYENEPVDNIRLALCDDPEIVQMIRDGERLTKLKHQYNDGTGVANIPLHKLLGIQPEVRGTPKIGRNDPCPCKSGKKYKKCCGAPD